MVENLIIEKVGDVGGNLHIARSRNDMGVTMYRMVLRKLLLQFIDSILKLKKALLFLALEHKETIMPAYTHTQQAQPTTLGHYLLAVYDQLSRDEKRLKSAFSTVNKSPMGAAAITTTGFDIDRKMMAELLGFDDIIENSYDAIASGDYLTETAAAAKLTCIHTGRFVHDLLIWTTQEYNFVKIADPYVQVSSIMPQKRNPVGLEHVRSLLSSTAAALETVVQMQHNTPFGDIVDTEDDAQPILWQSVSRSSLVFSLLASVLESSYFNRARMEDMAKSSFITVTELADTLVRQKLIPFRTAHRIVSKMVKEAISKGLNLNEISPEFLNEIAFRETGSIIEISEEDFNKALDPRNFINVRKIVGGPAPAEMNRMLEQRKEAFKQDEQWLKDAYHKINSSKQLLENKFEALMEVIS
jgi:argininosuccinate lyase